MTLPASVTRQFTDSITVETFVSEDVYGKPTYSASVTYDAFVRYKQTRIATAESRDTLSRGYLLLDGDTTLGSKDRVTLPTGDIVPLLEIQTFNRQGLSFQKVFF